MKISHDCHIGEEAFSRVQRPAEVNGQRAASPRFGDSSVMALLNCLVIFAFLPIVSRTETCASTSRHCSDLI